MASFFLAKVLGGYLFLVALAFIVHPKRCSSIVGEVHKSPALIFISGALALIFGLLIINIHNEWVSDWTVVITILGWLIFLKGIYRLFFWEHFISTSKEMMKKPRYIYASWISLAVGAYLFYMGYF